MTLDFNGKVLEYVKIRKVNYLNMNDLADILEIKRQKFTYLLPRNEYILVTNKDVEKYKLNVRKLNNRGERFITRSGLQAVIDQLDIKSTNFLNFLDAKLKPKKKFFLF